MQPSWECLGEESGHLVGRVGTVYVILFRGGPLTLETPRMLDRASRAWIARFGEGRKPMLMVVEPEVPPPDDAVRAALADLTARYAHVTAAEATVYEVGGFRGALVRGVMTGLRLLSRSTYPAQNFADAEAAAAWLEGFGDTRAGTIVEGLAVLRVNHPAAS